MLGQILVELKRVADNAPYKYPVLPNPDVVALQIVRDITNLLATVGDESAVGRLILDAVQMRVRESVRDQVNAHKLQTELDAVRGAFDSAPGHG